MAVPEQTPFIEYTANGTTTVYPLTFDCDKSEYLIVSLDGEEAPVGSWSFVNGSVTFNTAPASGVVVIIQRNTPLKRTTDYQSYNNSFKPSSVNKDFDWIWWKLQELWVQVMLIWAFVKSGFIDLQNQINALSQELALKVSELWSALNQEIANRISEDSKIKAWVLTLLNNIVDSGLVSAIAVTHVSSIDELSDLNKWDGRTVYVDSYHLGLGLGGGVFVYDATRSAENDGGHVLNGWVRKDRSAFNVYNFGAYGDGISDDTDSFLLTSTALRANNGGVLVIPQGAYVVGRQTSPAGYAYVGMDVIGLYGITGAVEIRLENPTITFKDDLYFGAWDRSTTPPTALTTITRDSKYYSSVGSMIYASNIPMLRITGVGTLDGNLDGVQLGGEWGDTGRQCWGNAFKILNVPDLQISTNIKTKNFPLDSIYIGNSNYTSDGNDYGTSKISGLNCDGNARQGLSLCGGTNYVIDSCSFKNIGHGSFSSMPKSGIDIEAESGDIRNIKFIACEVVNCAGFGVDDSNKNIDEVNFESCKFIGTTNYSVAVKRSTFTKSTFHGMVGITYRLAEDQKPIFNECTFSNDPVHSPYGTYLISTLGAGDMQAEFNDCTFILYSGQFIAKPEANDFRFRRCKFIIPATSTATGDANKIVGNFNSSFMEDCEFIDLRASGADYLYISILPQYKSKRNKCTSAISRLQFYWDRGTQSLSHTPSLDDAIGSVILAANKRGSAALDNTFSLQGAAAVPSVPVLSPSNTLDYYTKGSVVFNTNSTTTSAGAWHCTIAGYPCSIAWAANTAYTVQAGSSGYVHANGKVYKCSVAGTSGSTAPSHTSGTATDGAVTWTYIGVKAEFVEVSPYTMPLVTTIGGSGVPRVTYTSNENMFTGSVTYTKILVPIDSGAYSLGNSSRYWSQLYASTATINTSDERYKQQFRNQTEQERAAALEIKSNICLYKFNDAVELKGDDARWHVGVKAQQVVEILTKHGLNWQEYAFICYDEWDDELDSETGELILAAGSRYGVRYEELSMFLWASI
ncbi:TPA: hypothetical protein JI040_00490 [Acinetobacter baumannii]|nr:hypothetical protein [Acinetobacter baumannii]